MTSYNGFQDLNKRKRHNVKRRKSELQQHANQGAAEKKPCARDMTARQWQQTVQRCNKFIYQNGYTIFSLYASQ
ncbi:RagB/SusD family protein [Sesbania bispinosa]|nr:RagB/SusD family protein [Sesbania bispinosa]